MELYNNHQKNLKMKSWKSEILHWPWVADVYLLLKVKVKGEVEIKYCSHGHLLVELCHLMYFCRIPGKCCFIIYNPSFLCSISNPHFVYAAVSQPENQLIRWWSLFHQGSRWNAFFSTELHSLIFDCYSSDLIGPYPTAPVISTF